jgi:hypothetical protein
LDSKREQLLEKIVVLKITKDDITFFDSKVSFDDIDELIIRIGKKDLRIISRETIIWK